jgi:enoyl-[acyl-carrier-protein] reductase (NADH)
VEELALCAQFLCSPAASGINGQALVVDGGSSMLA